MRSSNFEQLEVMEEIDFPLTEAEFAEKDVIREETSRHSKRDVSTQ